MAATKIDDETIQVDVVVPETTTQVCHNINFLKQQEAQIIADRDAYVFARNAELAKVQELIAIAAVLGVEPTE